MLYVITVDFCVSSLELCIWSHIAINAFLKIRWLRKTIINNFYQNEIMNASAITRLFFPSSNLFSFIRTKVLIYYNLKFEIKYKYNRNQIRNITSLLASYIFSFFTGNGCSIQVARLILLKFGSQQITSVHKLMEDHVRQQRGLGLMQ